MSEPEFNANRKLHSKFLDFNGIRITPKCLMLRNAYDGKEYKEKILFQNISPSPVLLRTSLPTYSPFKLKNRLTDFKLFSGLSVAVRIEYNCINTLRNPVVESSMIVSINDKIMNYYISVQVSEGCMVAIPRSIDFGKVNLEHLVTSRKIKISNKGFKTSKFEIDLPTNDLELVVIPNQGYIPARGHKTVRIEFIGLQEGDFCKDIWVKCVTPFRIIVEAQVIRPKFLMDPRFKSTDNYYFIKFPPVYANCKGYRSIQFSNKNTLRTCFVVVPEVNGSILSYKKASEMDSAYNFFSILPIDGYLDAYEKKVIKFSFYPKAGTFIRRQTFFAYFRIIRLSSTNVENVKMETKEEDSDKEEGDGKSNMDERRHSVFPVQKEEEEDNNEESKSSVETFVKDNHDDSNYIRICVCATVEPLKVEINPEFINVGEVVINSTVNFSLNIKNKNNILPIYYRYRKTAFIDMIPREGFLNRLESTDLCFKYTPKACKKGKTFFTIELLYLNHVDKKENFQVVGEIEVNFFAKVNMPVLVPKTKFNLGITPLITNEVGYLTENIRFNDSIPKPRQAIVDEYVLKKNEENALIAFPNDRPSTLRKTNQKNEIIKTIFAKIPRYVMDRDIYMLSEDQENFRKLIQKIYNDYILINKSLKEYISPEIETDYSPETFSECRYSDTVSIQEESEKHIIHAGYYVLTPIQLFFIKVIPSTIDIGKVALFSRLKTNLKVVNRNGFAIKVTLHTRQSNKSYLTNLPQDFHVNASSFKTIEIEFNGIVKGKIYTIITAIINGHHKLPVVFKANVTPFDLIIAEKDIVINMKDINISKSINLYNVFDVPVSYVWEIAAGNSFHVLPKSGTVPPNTYLTSQVYYTPDYTNRISSKLCIEIINGLQYTLSATVFIEELNVEIFQKTIELPHIPLNIEYASKALLLNNGYEPIIYSIRNPIPIPGIQLSPTEGIIKRKSYQIIKIHILMQVVSSFECTIEIDIYNSTRPIHFDIKGTVDFPRIVMKPETMHLRKIQAGSLDLFPFFIENKGQSVVKVSYLENMAPEFFITKTIDPSTEKNLTEFFLLPGEKENLILKYFPIDVTMLTFYLPFVINDILGPAIVNAEETLRPFTYLEQYEKSYSVSELNFLTIPDSFPLILVESIAVRHILKVSREVLQYCYLQHPKHKSITELDTRLKNVSAYELDICIRLDDLRPNFNLKQKTSYNIQYNDNISISFTLDTVEPLILSFEYTPESRGNHTVNLPIYIRDYNDCAVFNYITLQGVCPKVNLICESEIQWDPIPLKEIIEYTLEVTIEYHTNNCILKAKTDVPYVKISYPKGSLINSEEMSVKIPVLLTFSSDKPFSFRSILTVSCDCGATKYIKFKGCTDSSILTTYLFSFENVQKKTVNRKSLSSSNLACKSSTIILHNSLHTKISETTDKNSFIHKLCLIVEEWLCQQVFYGKYYFSIPEHLSELFYEVNVEQEVQKTKKKHKITISENSTPKAMLLIIKILVNLLGDKILPELISRAAYRTEIDRIHQYHVTHINVLKFLEVQGAYLQSVQPKYMLNYDDYLIYENKIRILKGKIPSQYILNKSQFNIVSKHVWVNILLQVFKVLVLPRVNRKPISTASFSIKEISEQTIKSETCAIDTKAEPEDKLLHWATIHFNKNRHILMKLDNEKKYYLEERIITNFEKDFSDGLVIIALIISYIPYLEEHLTNIFIELDSQEKKFHNACKIVHVLKIINYSYNLKPMDIIQPFAIQIIIFLTYLHEVLPYFLPTSTLKYNVSLSKSKTEEIALKNMETKIVNYTVIFLNNKLECFSANCGSSLQIPPSKSVRISITFTAKLMSLVTSTLIFCGETVGGHYARTIVYTLEGEPNFDEEHDIVVYKLPLYTVTKKPLIVQSPYRTVAKYNIYIRYTKILDVQSPEVNSSKIKFNLVYIEHPFVECDKNGTGEVKITVCSLTPILQEFWILFRDNSQGDFFIKVEISMLSLSEIEKRIITLMLPVDFDNIKCICPNHNIVHQKSCPRNVFLKIPCKNDVLWNTIYEMILTTVEETEIDSWKNILYCDTGPDILSWFARENSKNAPLLVQHVFERSVRYHINGPKFLDLTNFIYFDDVRHGGTADINVHLPKTFPTKFTITMKSLNDIELRMYEVHIVYEKIEKTKPKLIGA